MTRYRAAIIGLGWMGLLYDLARRTGSWNAEDVERPTPALNIHRKFHLHEHPGREGLPNSYAEALWDRPEIDLIAAVDRDQTRLEAFCKRYGIDALYTDAGQMLASERPQIVAIATNVKGRADLTSLALEHGAIGILTEKPMCHRLEEADRMVRCCAQAGVPLSCGSITTTHPSFARARTLLSQGAIGQLRSIETDGTMSQHQNWSYFLDSGPAWVTGVGDEPRRESGSNEFRGQGMLVATDGLVIHFRHGAPGVRLTGTRGQIEFDNRNGWRLFQQLDPSEVRWAQMPWPDPQFVPPYGAVYMLDDVMECLAGRLDEPKNSGRRAAVALEVEIALKESAAQDGMRVDLPLADRSLGLHYDAFR